MSGWAARIDDTDRMRRVRLIALKGQRGHLAHQRDLLRRDLGVELQQHCRADLKTAVAIEIEQKIHAVHQQWLGIIAEIREVQKGAAA